MTASLLALYAGLSLSFGASGTRVESAWLDPWLGLSSPGLASVPWVKDGRASGLAFPGLVWWSDLPGALAHEMSHVRQVQALGAPVHFLGYLGTGGLAFEDYLAGDLWPLPAWTGSPRCPMLTWRPAGLSLWACRS